MVANSAVEAQLIGAVLAANAMAVGTTYRITADGVIGTTTAAPTATWRVRIGAVTLTGAVVTSVAPTLAVSQTNKPWRVDFLVTVRSAGAAGAAIANGVCINEASATAPNFAKGSGTVATAAVDTTQSRVLELTFQFGTANAANTLTVHNATIELVKS